MSVFFFSFSSSSSFVLSFLNTSVISARLSGFKIILLYLEMYCLLCILKIVKACEKQELRRLTGADQKGRKTVTQNLLSWSSLYDSLFYIHYLFMPTEYSQYIFDHVCLIQTLQPEACGSVHADSQPHCSSPDWQPHIPRMLRNSSVQRH